MSEPVDYDKLTDREIDVLVAINVMGWKPAKGGPYWSPSLDDRVARLVRNRIAELGLEFQFCRALDLFASGENGTMTKIAVRGHQWNALQATPRQQCIAALRAKGKEHDEPSK
jgi:hypothetical protein